jgi:hypothetical protein
MKTPFMPQKREKETLAKEAFYAWLETGTCGKARNYLTKRGIINPRTGKPYTYMAVYLGAYSHLVNNHESLKSVLFDLWGFTDDDMTQQEWEAYIVGRATVVLGNSSKKRFMEWLSRNSWAKEYDYIYAKRFGLRQESS